MEDGSNTRITSVNSTGKLRYEQDGQAFDHSATYFRGETTNFHPKDRSLDQSWFISEYLAKGLMPDAPLFDQNTSIVAFGSCFAAHIANYLAERNYNISTKREGLAYISHMGDGIVSTHAIRQQFEWAWLNRRPQADVWHDRDLESLGFGEDVRLATKALFDEAETFIITLGLSEIWYDEPTGEVFWRAVPARQYDPARHKFRVSNYEENVENLNVILDLIRERRPSAEVILTLSPVPLAATFRPIPCMVADAESKAILRAALGRVLRARDDGRLHYLPSYEIVQRCFNYPYSYDRTHVHRHVIDLVMAVFERYYCKSQMSDAELFERFVIARSLDRRVARKGHKSVPSFTVKD